MHLAIWPMLQHLYYYLGLAAHKLPLQCPRQPPMRPVATCHCQWWQHLDTQPCCQQCAGSHVYSQCL